MSSMAEGVGIEPTRPVARSQFSKLLPYHSAQPSTGRPILRGFPGTVKVVYWGHMPRETKEDILAAIEDRGQEIMGWLIDEYERHERGPVWYASAFLVGVGLILYALITQNFLFAIIIVMFGVIVGLSTLREPERILFQMTTRGIAVGDLFFPYKELKDFWIVYEPPYVKNIYFEHMSVLTPRIVVPIEDEDPLKVRRALLDYLHENGTSEEPLRDLWGRVLKL